ncbi:MAG TPA: hypothetical protein VK995_00805 [Oceanipulchritudo sp.]|nr:hypothetical protein [Oceanipulchritudo sp.]
MGTWKLIERFETGSLELYNLADDMAEMNDLSSENPNQLSLIKTVLETWHADMGSGISVPADPQLK